MSKSIAASPHSKQPNKVWALRASSLLLRLCLHIWGRGDHHKSMKDEETSSMRTWGPDTQVLLQADAVARTEMRCC